MKAVVLAYHEIGYVCLEELLRSRIQVSALFTHTDDPDEEIWFRTPRSLAESRGVPVFEPESLIDQEWIDRIKAFDPDYIFSFYYRNMLPQEVLDIPRVAALNLHGSLLPKYRGRCPVNWVLVKGETKTGVTLHIMEVKPDAGDIVAQKEVDIAFEDTAQSLALKLTEAARSLMQNVMAHLESGNLERKPQSGPSSYFGGRRPEDGEIDWESDAGSIYDLIRAVTHPYPGAFTTLAGRKLFIWKAVPVADESEATPGSVISLNPLLVKTGRGSLSIRSLQLEGEEEKGAEAFLTSHNIYNKQLGGSS